MNLVTLTNVSHQYSERVLLENAQLLINRGDRIGLIGINGSGKTTLLRIVAGEERANAGTLTVWGGVRIRYLPQDPSLEPQKTVLQTIFDSPLPAIRLLQQYEQTNQLLQQNPHDSQLQAQLAAFSDELTRTGGWAAEAQAKAILTRLGITNFQALVGTLSGGQQKRVALAQVLLDAGDLLILDEPTNHIDTETVAWLEDFLREMPASLLMVTHDRYFLEHVANRIVEIDRRQLINYPGNYHQYLELRQLRHENLTAAEIKRQNQLRRELEWLRRGAQARSTKQKARKQRVEELQKIQYDAGTDRISIALASRRLGKKVLTAHNLAKQYNQRPIFANVSLELAPGERIGLIGANGVGKSTLLDILAGELTPDKGRCDWGETVQIGYYDQQSRHLPLHRKVIDYLNDIAPLLRTPDGERIEAAQMLEWFLFPRPQQQATISALSGGEKRRLYLLAILATQPNVLLLDEPTNDLDLSTLQVLEQFLDHFQGCLIVASHDRYFLDRNVDFLATFTSHGLSSRYPTPFETFLKLQQPENSPSRPQPQPKQPALTTPSQANKKRSWKEQREIETLERQIGELENRQQQLQQAINKGEDYLRLREWVQELEQVEMELDQAVSRWLELAEQ